MSTRKYLTFQEWSHNNWLWNEPLFPNLWHS